MSHVKPLGTVPGYDIISPGTVVPDPDLREYHSRMALASISKRHSPKRHPHRPSQTSAVKRATQPFKTPLFVDEEDDLEAAIQQSLEQHDAEVLQRTIESSKNDALSRESSASAESSLNDLNQKLSADPDSDSDLYVPAPSRLETALAFANTSPNKRSFISPPKASNSPSLFGHPSLLQSETSIEVVTAPPNNILGIDDDESEEMEEVAPISLGSSFAVSASEMSEPRLSDTNKMQVEIAVPPHTESGARTTTSTDPQQRESPPTSSPQDNPISVASNVNTSKSVPLNPIEASKGHVQGLPQVDFLPSVPSPHLALSTGVVIEDIAEENIPSDWDRSPSPGAGNSSERDTSKLAAPNEDWDAAQEMDVVAEERDFAQFLSQMKGQDLEAARREIDNEIRDLNKQKKVAMRDSEDVTQHMISQIMVQSPDIANFIQHS